MTKIWITGATGFVGRALIKELTEAGEAAAAFSRDPAKASSELGVEAARWDPMAGVLDPEALAGARAVVHLAGESVAEGRWSEAKKARIMDSRVRGTEAVVSALAALPAEKRPPVLVSASAVGYYGDRGDEELTEESAPGSDFLAEVCKAWEREARKAEALGVRVVCLRIGIVLGEDGGALSKMLTPFKLGVGGRLGSGQQWMPWIHRDDLVGLIRFAIDQGALSGPVNAAAPKPVINRDFTSILASALHRPAFLPAPGFGLRLALGEFAEVLLGSQRVLPERALEAGYSFRFPQLEGALAAILGVEAPSPVNA